MSVPWMRSPIALTGLDSFDEENNYLDDIVIWMGTDCCTYVVLKVKTVGCRHSIAPVNMMRTHLRDRY